MAFDALVRENLTFSRLALDRDRPGASRGLQTLRSLINVSEEEQARWDGGGHAHDMERAVTVAKEVKSDRVALQNPAGLVKPSDWLPAGQREEFEDVEGRRLVPSPDEVPRSCLLISPEEEGLLRHRMLASDMAVLIEECDIAHLKDGRLLLAGLFCVPHNEASDRLIVDRRPANEGDARLGWSTLPLGPQLCQAIIGPGEVLRGSGDDLRTYFYCLENAEDAVPYNAFGRRLTGSAEWKQYGAAEGRFYRLALRVTAMGDRNAVDVANETHRGVLHAAGCLRPGEELAYGWVYPSGGVIEACYIDDHIVVACVSRAAADLAEGRDADIIRDSRAGYARALMPLAE